MNDNRPKSAAEVTPEMIESWKGKYPKGICELSVLDQPATENKEATFKKGWIKKPDRNNMKAALTMLGQGGRISMLETLLEDTWLGGDEELLQDDDFFFGAINQMEELLQVKNGELKKL